MKIYKYEDNTKFISRKEAYKQLKLSHKDFKKLCILTNTKPAKAKNTLKYDHSDTIFYEISSIQKMIDSKEYDNLLYKNKIKTKKIEYENSYMPERLKHLPIIDFNYKDILKSKYQTFNDAVIGLNESLNFYNEEFNNFVFECNMLDKIYLTNTNVYFKVKVNDVELFYNYHVGQYDDYRYLNEMSYYHVMFVLHKLKEICEKRDKNKIFENVKFKLMKEDKLLAYIIEYCGGTFDDCFDIFIGDEVENFDVKKVYLQPQFLFDSFNEKNILSYDEYKIGKILPIHKVPTSQKIKIDESLLAVMSKTKKRKYEEYTKQ